MTFKLLGAGAGSHRFLRSIGPPPECGLDLTGEGRKLGKNELAGVVRSALLAVLSLIPER